MARTINYREAISEALLQEMRRDERVVVMGEDNAGGAGAPGADDAAVARDQAAATMRAIAALPPPLRTALVLVQMEGLSYRDAAEITDVPEATVRGRLHRARKQLVDHMRSWS